MKLPNGFGSVTKLSGKRRKPYIVRKTVGWHMDEEKGKCVQEFAIIGYAATKKEGYDMLAAYNADPYDVELSKVTFAEVYERWSKTKFPTIKEASIKAHTSAYKICEPLYDKPFVKLRLADLQYLIDNCEKNFPMLKKIKTLLNQLYAYAMKYDIVKKDYAKYIDIAQYVDKNPNQREKKKFTDAEVDKFWEVSDDTGAQTVLMLIYSGVRIYELLTLEKESVNIEKQYFEVVDSKTVNGIRTVPIADKVLPFFKHWYEDGDSDFLLHKEDGSPLLYDTYRNRYFDPVMKHFGLDHTPHSARHTCISKLAQAEVSQTYIKKIVGHSGAMTLTEKVYTHLDIEELINAINKI